MKTIRAITTLIAAICGITATAATTWSGSQSLTTDVTENESLTIESGADIDIAGHDVTLNGTLTVNGKATITNSDSGDVKTVTLKCTNNLTSQFQNLTFSGNLKLVVSGDCSNAGGFQGVSNTHTGGTVLDAYGTTSGNEKPRFSTGDAFGSGSLTMKNGSRVMNKGGENTLSLTGITFEGSDTINGFWAGDTLNFPYTLAFHVAEGDRANIHAEAWIPRVRANLDDMKGILSFHAGTRQCELQTNVLYGVVELNSGVTVRCNYNDVNGGSGALEIAALQTHPDITETNGCNIVNTTGWSTLAVTVGSLNTDTTFYGILKNDGNGKNISLTKVGTGILTLGGANSYQATTTLTGGAIRLVGSGTLGASGDVLFNGGELIFGADVATDPSSRFKTADGKTAKIGVDEGVTQTISGTLSNCAAVEKTRAGTLVIPRETALKAVTITAGFLAVPGDPTWENGDVVTLYSYTTSGSTAPVKDTNFKITGLGARQDYTLTTEEEDGTTTVKATISNTVLGWTGGSGKWSDANAWNSSLTYQTGDAVAFNAASFASSDSIAVEVDTDVSPSALAFDIPEGKTLALTGAGAIALAGNIVKNGAGTLVLGNGVNSIATKTIAVNEGTLKLGADQPFDALDYTLYLEENAVLDLNGHELMVGTATKQATDGGSCIVTNSVESVGTLTAGVNNGTLGFNSWATFGGNVRYIFTGNNKTHFRNNNSTRAANTLTGAIVVSNNTQGVRIYGNKNTGTGNIGFAGNSKLEIPSQYLGTLTDFAGIEVSGTNNTFKIEGFSGGATVTFNGALTGDGELTLSNGFKPSIHFDGDTSGFEGTIRLKYNANETWRGLFFERANLSGMTVNDGTATMSKGAIVLDNGEDSTMINKIWVAGMIYTSTPSVFEIGDLTTASADTNIYANSSLRTYKGGLTLKVGALNKSGTFAAPIIQHEIHADSGVKSLSLVKTGTGTWTLNGDGHSWGGTTTVEGGRLNLDGSVFSAGTEIIVTNATLGGNATVTVPVTVKNDGVLAGSLTASSVTFDTGSSIEVAADATETTTISGDVDVSGVTVKLTGELDTTQEYTILTAGGDSAGKATVAVDTPSTKGTWKTKWVAGEGDVKVLKGYFSKNGLIIILR